MPKVFLIFWIGVQPGGFFDVMNASTNELVAHVESSQTEVVEANPVETNAEFAYVGEPVTSEAAE